MRPFFKPNQVLFVGLTAYRIVGVYLGGEKSQNLIGISPIGEPFTLIDGIRTSEVCVPEVILLALIKEQGAELLENIYPMQPQLEVAKNALRRIKENPFNTTASVFTDTAIQALNCIKDLE